MSKKAANVPKILKDLKKPKELFETSPNSPGFRVLMGFYSVVWNILMHHHLFEC